MTFAPASVLQVIDALNEIGVRYMLTGSLARNMYCIPRSTVDADFIAEMTSPQLNTLRASMKADFIDEPQMAFETVTGKVQHRFRHRDSKFLIEVFEANLDDPHERSRFERRRSVTAEGRVTFVPAPEDIIIQKLRWYVCIHRPKDRQDVIEILEEQWDRVDWEYMEKWCREHESLSILNDLRGDVGSRLSKER